MNKLFAFIIIIMFLAYVPLGPVNYSSELSGIFIFLGDVQNILASTISIILTYIFSSLMVAADNLLLLMVTLYNIVLSLPYEKINFWYVLLIFIIVSFFAEKFRTINNELNKLNKKLNKIKNNTQSENISKSSTEISALNEKSEAILKLLSEISTAAESFKNNYVRSKKIRRETINVINNTETIDAKKQIVEPIEDDIESVEEHQSDEIMSDNNLSQIDLARAFVESNERESAIDLIKKIIDTGTEDEKHEAKLLYMQVK